MASILVVSTHYSNVLCACCSAAGLQGSSAPGECSPAGRVSVSPSEAAVTRTSSATTQAMKSTVVGDLHV